MRVERPSAHRRSGSPAVALHRGAVAGSILAAALVAAIAPTPADASAAFQVRERDPAATAATLAALRARDTTAPPVKIWVYFTDKGIFDSETCDGALDDLRGSLSAHARQRRARTLGSDLVDFYDIPVHQPYRDALESLGADVLRESRWLNAVSVRAPFQTLEAIAALPFVQKLVPVRGYRRARIAPSEQLAPPGIGADPFDYGPSHDQLQQIGVIEAHTMGYSGAGVVLAMLDTGFYKDHAAFADAIADGRLLAEWDFINDDGNTQNESGDDLFQHFHGTATWSAAGGFDEGELIGPAYGASFLLAKTEDVTSETPVEEDNWAAAAEWADLHEADVISSSLGYLDWYTYEDMDGNTAVTTIAADIAVSRGIVVCNSAGNEGNSDWYYVIAPADGDSVIAVGAVNVFGELAGFSSHGPTFDGRIKPDVLACGDGTYCAYTPETGGTYGWASGTSLSCPLVAGAAALVLEARPGWSPMTVREALRNTADHSSSPDNDYGWGIINVPAAIDAVLGASETPKPPLAGRLQVRPNPLSTGATLSYLLPDGVHQGEIDVFDGAGRRIFARPVADRSGGVAWDGRDEDGRRVPAGVYLVRLRAEEWNMTRKAVVRR